MAADPEKVTPGVLDEYAKGAFKYGGCGGLAIAMHDAFGWPIVAITDDHNVFEDGTAGGGSALHWAVRAPDKPDRWLSRIEDPIRAAGLTRQEALLFRRTAHKPAPIDGTYYVGPEKGPVQVKIMDKVTDERANTAGTYRELPPGKRRARTEVTVFSNHARLGQGIALERFDRVDDLYDFQFYYLIQNALIHSELRDDLVPIIQREMADLATTFGHPSLGHIFEAANYVSVGDYYKAMRALRSVLEHETKLFDHISSSARASASLAAE